MPNLFVMPKSFTMHTPPPPTKSQRIYTIQTGHTLELRGGPDPRTPPASSGPDCIWWNSQDVTNVVVKRQTKFTKSVNLNDRLSRIYFDQMILWFQFFSNTAHNIVCCIGNKLKSQNYLVKIREQRVQFDSVLGLQ